MMALAGMLADVSRAATGSLVAAVWQGVLLAVAVWLGLRLLPKTPAAVRFAIWFGVFLVVTALPVLSLWPRTAAVAAGGHSPWLMLDPRWSLTVAAVWLLASAWRAGQLVVAAVRVRGLWKRATPVDASFGDRAAMNEAPSPGLKPGDLLGVLPRAEERVEEVSVPGRQLQNRVAGAEARLDDAVLVPGLKSRPILRASFSAASEARCYSGGQRRVELCSSDEVDRPTVIGFLAPKIVLPAWLLEKLTPAELEQVVLHESGHLGRADDWMNLLQKVALVVFPLNPALAWVERRLCFERELACDERVLRKTGAPKAYASCLATLAEYRLGRRGLALAIGILGRESELGQRVGRILRRGAQMKPWHARLVLGGAMLGLVVAATGLERCPQLVGFSDAGSGAVAHRQQGPPTHGDETAMNGAPRLGVQPVVFRMGADRTQEWKTVGDADLSVGKLNQNKGIHKDIEAIHKTEPAPERALAVAQRMPDRREDKATQPRRASVEDSAQAGDVVVTQWTMVTQFHDGSRMVLTTAQISSSAPRIEQDSDRPAAAQQDVRPYAAVPVRGGWLVFQL
jgi:Zn-dependent protease with chaperone function